MTDDEALARWKALVGDDSPRAWRLADLAGFFQAFRPAGEGVAAAFDGISGGDEILPRLLDVYRATAADWRQGDGQDVYFVVRRPLPLAVDQARARCAAHLGKLGRMAHELRVAGEDDPSARACLRASSSQRLDEVIRLLDPLPAIAVASGKRPWPPPMESPETVLYELANDYMAHLRFDRQPRASHAHLMEEAFYTLTCDYQLQSHLLWPLYRHLTAIHEPFGDYFELWKHGAAYRFEGADQVTLFVPNLE